MSESDCPTLDRIALFKAIVVNSACIASCVVNMESRFSASKALLPGAEKLWTIVLIEELNSFLLANDNGGNGMIMEEYSHLISWESAILGLPMQIPWLLFV